MPTLYITKLFAGFEEDSAGFEQGSANYLGSNRILRGSWPHGPPPLIYVCLEENREKDCCIEGCVRVVLSIIE